MWVVRLQKNRTTVTFETDAGSPLIDMTKQLDELPESVRESIAQEVGRTPLAGADARVFTYDRWLVVLERRGREWAVKAIAEQPSIFRLR